MSIVAKDSSRNWTPAPEGLHQGVCVDVIDMGMVQTQWGEKHKVRIVWQIEEVNPETSKRFDVSSFFGLSLSEKSRLRPTLEAWRGRKFSKEELEGFDLEKLIGAACQIQIVHNISDEGKVYGNVQAIVPAAKGQVKISPQDYVRAKDREKQQGTAAAGEMGADDTVPF